jgi:hypothetical protein
LELARCLVDGDAALDRGRLSESRCAYWRAAALAQERGDAEALARAAIGLGGIWVNEHRTIADRARVSRLQQQALAGLPAGTPLALRLEARLAAEHSYLTSDVGAILACLDRARANGDPVAVAETLSLAHNCLLGPEYAGPRLELAEELVAISGSTGRSRDRLIGLMWRTVDLFMAGDWRAARSLRELTNTPGWRDCACVRYVVAAIEVMLSIRSGAFDVAERRAAECFELGVEVGDADGRGWFGVQLMAIRWLQGRAGELYTAIQDLASCPSMVESNDAVLAAVAAAGAWAGQHDEARGALATLRARGFATMRNSSCWLVLLFGAIDAAALLGDTSSARELYDLLAPYAEQPLLASLAVACFGSAHRSLGRAAMAFGDFDLAVRHLEAAVQADLRFGHHPSHAVSMGMLATALEARRGDGDAHRAHEVAEDARARATALGMDGWVTTWTGSRSNADVEVVAEGKVWRVTAQCGRSPGAAGVVEVRVPDSLGMSYIARLVASPGAEIDAAALVSQHQVPDSAASKQPVLDRRAVEAYRSRMTALREAIDRAEDRGDTRGAAAAQAEFDALMTELQRVSGYGGEIRNFATESERARVAVQKAIKRALDRLAHADASLAALLAGRLTTGVRCVYQAR